MKNETEALLLEGKLIKEYRPKYNVVFRDDKRFMMLKVNLSDALPRFQLVRIRKEDGSRYFGPFPHSGALRFTFHWINKQFSLRTCRSVCPGESDYKHCNDDVIRNCSAPCIGKVSSEKYRDRVKEACQFLEGGWRDRISEIESQMDEASSNQEYELEFGKTPFFGENVSHKTKQALELAKSWGAEYMRFSDLIEGVEY